MHLNTDIKKILGIFLLWKIYLFICLLVAINYIPLAQIDRFLGGGLSNYLKNPYLFSWANFDGEHYIAIAIFGYKGLEQAFFPVYPILINFFSRPDIFNIPVSLFSASFWGLAVSNFSLLASLILIFKLIIIDYPKKIAWLTLILLLVFPTSFYFGAVYSESLFLLLSLLAFFFARKGNFFLASTVGIIASATRIFGFLLLPAFFIEAKQQKIPLRKYFWIFLIPLGLIFYMIYQWWLVGDPLAFYRLQKIVGEQHQSGLTILPQVYFRYLKMLLTVNPFDPIYQTIILEFFSGILFFILPIYGYFKKVSKAYIFYAIVGFLLPTIQGSFSSVPRYILVFFPSFLCLAIFISGVSKFWKIFSLAVLTAWLGLEAVLFLRGYWVA